MESDKNNPLIFRIHPETYKKLQQAMSTQKVIGIKSLNQFGRKIISDFLDGRLVYTKPEFASQNPDLKK